MLMPAARMRAAAISPSWCTAAGGTPERDDDNSDGDLHGSRCHAARFPVNDRTPGTALAVCLAGTGRGRRHETHDGRGRGHLEDPSCFQSDGRRGDGNKSSIRQPK